MFANARRHRGDHGLDIWPGFVDALATLLMVVVFVLMALVMSQFYLTDALTGREETLSNLNKQLDLLSEKLHDEKTLKEASRQEILTLQAVLQRLQNELGVTKEVTKQTSSQLVSVEAEKENALGQVKALLIEVATLNKKLADLSALFSQQKQHSQVQKQQFEASQEKLNQSLADKIEEIKRLRLQHGELHKKTEGDFGQYRSEFFMKLKEVLGDRSDIRVVDDRFVFQSEVLFDKASAELGPLGKKQLDQLAGALRDIAKRIPQSVSWILRVDGHTDRTPIHTAQYPSNWELSAARAIAVVRYLIAQGIEARRLVAAGFGELQPLQNESSEKAHARNRRIEFKLDQK